MPKPALALRLNKYRRRFGVLSPKVVVRGYLPRAVLLLITVSLATVFVGIGWVAASYFDHVGYSGDESVLRRQLQLQFDELVFLRSVAGAGQNAVDIERATQQKLLVKISVLEAENAALKEDMRIFERLIPQISDGAFVRIENFRVSADQGGRYRYRLLIIFQPDKQQKEFRGRLQLAVSYVLSGEQRQLILPDGPGASERFQLEVRSILRREGEFELPPGAVLRSVESRLLQGDAIKSKQLAQI